MAKTDFRPEGRSWVAIQSRLWGLHKRDMIRCEPWQDKFSLMPLIGSGVKINGEVAEGWKQRLCDLGDKVELPWGGWFIVTQAVLQGEKPSIMEG